MLEPETPNLHACLLIYQFQNKNLSKNNYLKLAFVLQSKQHSLTTTFSLRFHLDMVVEKRIELDQE